MFPLKPPKPSSIAKGNIGEKNEVRLIRTLISLNGKYIKSLGLIVKEIADYSGREFSSEPEKAIIAKAPIFAKRDVLINGKGYSLKTISGSPPAIVNHTTREKWLRVCKSIGLNIDLLDEMVEDYWNLRNNRKITEDVTTSNSLCPFGNTPSRKQYLKSLIEYFLFDGSGTRDSLHPADYVLEFFDPKDPTTWRVLDRQTVFLHQWPKMIFSLRSKKGMPPKYPDIDPAKKRLIEPWVRYTSNDYRGALHIRTRR